MAYLLIVGASVTKVVAEPEEFSALHDYLSCEKPTYARRGGKVERVDATYHALDRRTCMFPSGLLSLVVQYLRSSGAEVHVEEAEPGMLLPPCPLNATTRGDLDWLRPYQLQAVEGLLVASRGILKAATGAGKTEVIIGMTMVVPVDWIVVCSSAHLVDQFTKRYRRRTGEDCGTLDKGRWRRGSSNVTVATFQAINLHLRRKPAVMRAFLLGFQAVAVDEVHEQPAKTFYGVVMEMRNARYRYGFSATPLHRSKYDTLRTVGAVGPVIHTVDAATLVAAGVLAQSRITMRRYQHVCVAPASWREVYRQRVVFDQGRNELLAEMARDSAKPFLLFVDEVQHAKNLARPLLDQGLRTIEVDGERFVSERAQHIREMVAGNYDGIVCTKVFQQGVDIPELASVIVGCAKASAASTIQRVGRGMRAAVGKSGFEVWDVYDVGQHWLHKHSEARRVALEDEGHLVTVL